MTKTQALNTTQTHDKLLDDNKELIRIIGTALYPAIKQLELLQEAREEIRRKNFIWAQSSRKGNRLGEKFN